MMDSHSCVRRTGVCVRARLCVRDLTVEMYDVHVRACVCTCVGVCRCV